MSASAARTETIVFAALATVLGVGAIVVLVLPSHEAPAPSATSESASSSAPIAPATPSWSAAPIATKTAPAPTPTTIAAPSVTTQNEIVLLSTGDPSKTGADPPLDVPSIQSTVDRYAPRLPSQCPAERTTNVVVLVTIAPDGWIRSSKVQSTDGTDDVAKCVASKVQRWHFRSSPDGGTATIPLTLAR